MKIPFRDIDKVLATPDKACRALLLYGPDAGLARARAQAVKAAVLAESGDPFAFVELEEPALREDPARLNDEIMAIGLLSSKRLILVRDAGDKLVPLLEAAAPSLHDQVFLLVTAGELPPRSALRGWFEDVANAAAIACYRDEIRDLQQLVRRQFAVAGIKADADSVDYLCAQLGNDREVTHRELEKIITFAGETRAVSLEEVQALVDYNRDTRLDDIVFAVADKNIAALDAMLGVHLREGTMPVAYIRALQRYFNRLYYIKSQAEAGHDIESVVQNLKPKVFFKQVPVMVRHARNWPLPHIVRALRLLISAELTCKSSDIPMEAASSRRLFQVAQVR